MVLENAKRLKSQSDKTAYSLNLETFKDNRAKDKAEAKKYENIFKPIDGLQVFNLEEDLPKINMDESKVESNNEWIKSIREDPYIDEVLYIMGDLYKK